MMIAAGVVTAIILIVAGYVYTYSYFNDGELSLSNIKKIKLTKNRKLYLLGAIVSSIVLITLFQTVYHLHWLSCIRLLSLVLIMFPIGIIDARVTKIPNKILLFAMMLRIILFVPEFIISPEMVLYSFKECLIAMLVFGGFFFLIALIFKNSIGMGDVKLFAVIGFYQGIWGGINSIFFSQLVAFFLAIILLITKKKNRNDSISFGPSALIGTMIAIAISGM